LRWSVELQGFDGSLTACIECSPIETIECVRRPDRAHDDEATVLVTPPFENSQTVSTATVDAESQQAGLDSWVRPHDPS
jgi:hypothetical protein